MPEPEFTAVGGNLTTAVSSQYPPEMSAETLLQMWLDAGDTRTSARELRRIARWGDLSMRLAIARNVSCPVDLLVKLSEDRNDDVRRAVACNENTPFEVQLLLVAEVGLTESDIRSS
jgi:hypothetical protein